MSSTIEVFKPGSVLKKFIPVWTLILVALSGCLLWLLLPTAGNLSSEAGILDGQTSLTLLGLALNLHFWDLVCDFNLDL